MALKMIQLIEIIEYRGVMFDEKNDDIKIIDTQFTERYLIKTDSGFHPITNVHLTQPYTKYILKTENGKSLECADNHIIFDKNMSQVFIKDLNEGDYIQTDEGLSKILKLHKTDHKICMGDVTVASGDHRYYSNGILSHNTVTSAIFMLWFMLFQSEKTVLCVADNFTTTKELLDKFKITLEGLPFFMKPGIVTTNAGRVEFDNKSRIVGRTTTKKSGIGLSVNLLYIDEFAHIEEAKLNEFYRAIYPTVTADPNGKIIITSTPNGRNKFWEIWKDAIDGKSSYVPMRVDWWQIAGRGEEWKQQQIADMGSVEDFNQEYGLQFFSSDKLLLNSRDLKKLENIRSKYVQTNLILNEDLAHFNEYIYFHKKYANRTVEEWKNSSEYYVFSVDTSDGIGKDGDYCVLNIYKTVALPIGELLKKKEIIRNEIDTISLVQVGYLRSNEIDINEFAIACEHIIYNIFKADNTRIVIEMNHKGEIILNQFKENNGYWIGQIVHTKHTAAAIQMKPGIKLGPTNKIKYCEKFKYLVTINRIIPNDEVTVTELQQFGKSKGGLYRGQNGHDDMAMSSVNVSSVFDSTQFWDIAIDTFEKMGESYVRDLNEKIFDLVNGNKRAIYDYDAIKNMNADLNRDTNNKTPKSNNVFNLETLDQLEKIQNKFFKNK
jgi:hypothetical protein